MKDSLGCDSTPLARCIADAFGDAGRDFENGGLRPPSLSESDKATLPRATGVLGEVRGKWTPPMLPVFPTGVDVVRSSPRDALPPARASTTGALRSKARKSCAMRGAAASGLALAVLAGALPAPP
mmetsp:Transcript_107712/g.190773  ORF Transcript_107712/g.190773 Transcript_107712/m.190773 type:complete len:125 (-) Transcript_107712:1-375(-)